MLGRREREERSAQLDKWVFLEAPAHRVEKVPQEQGVCQVIMAHKDDKDLLDLLEPQEHLELQDQVEQQGPRGNTGFEVLLVPKAIREKEVMFSPKLLYAPSHGKCVSSSSRATCLAITPY